MHVCLKGILRSRQERKKLWGSPGSKDETITIREGTGGKRKSGRLVTMVFVSAAAVVGIAFCR